MGNIANFRKSGGGRVGHDSQSMFNPGKKSMQGQKPAKTKRKAPVAKAPSSGSGWSGMSGSDGDMC